MPPAAGAGVDREGVREMGLGGVEAFHGCVGQLAHAVPDGDAAQAEPMEDLGDPGRRGEAEEDVGGRAVAHAGAQIEKIVERDPGGVAEAAQSGGARRGDPPGAHIEHGRTVQLAQADALRRRQRERDLDQGGGRQLGVWLDPELVPGAQIPDEQTAVQTTVVQLAAQIAQQGLGAHAAVLPVPPDGVPAPLPAGAAAPRQRAMASPRRASTAWGLPSPAATRANPG